ncbi:MAG: hypothetical protein ACPF9W_05540, partial [Nocardioides sp.]
MNDIWSHDPLPTDPSVPSGGLDRAQAVVALGGGHGLHASLRALRHLVDDVVVDDLRVAGTVAPTRTIWAVERDRGERSLQLKVNFPRQRGMGALSLAARVVATADGAEERTAGGEPQQPQRGGAGHQA